MLSVVRLNQFLEALDTTADAFWSKEPRGGQYAEHDTLLVHRQDGEVVAHTVARLRGALVLVPHIAGPTIDIESARIVGLLRL